AGKPEVVVTGFGRTDTHELPNSLTWGPDGWLYGLNGVFNHSHVKHKGKDYDFTCALFRIHPKTRDFELFCEGPTNPSGLTWYTPVVQKTGPDGCLYILDWYDRYHCYQDANRDPQGIDRQRGRLYRVRYKDTPRAGRFDLAKETDDRLLERLHSPNVYFRDLA